MAGREKRSRNPSHNVAKVRLTLPDSRTFLRESGIFRVIQ